MAPWPHDLWLTVSHVQMDAAAVPLSPASLVSVLVFNRVGKVSISANPPALNLGAALVRFTWITENESGHPECLWHPDAPHDPEVGHAFRPFIRTWTLLQYVELSTVDYWRAG